MGDGQESDYLTWPADTAERQSPHESLSGDGDACLLAQEGTSAGQESAAERAAARLVVTAIAEDLWEHWVQGTPQSEQARDLGRNVATTARRAARRDSALWAAHGENELAR